MPAQTALSVRVTLPQSVIRVALTQLLPEPVEVKVQGLDPCSEVRVRYGPWFHTIVAPVGRLLTVNEAPEEQTKEGPVTGPAFAARFGSPIAV